MIELGRSVKGVYDEPDRLLSYGKLDFQYDALGNLSRKIENLGPSIPWLKWLPWLKHFWHKTGKTDYTFDGYGNLKSVVLPDGKQIEYVIDGQNRRVGKKVNGQLVQGFVYQTQTQIAAELDGQG